MNAIKTVEFNNISFGNLPSLPSSQLIICRSFCEIWKEASAKKGLLNTAKASPLMIKSSLDALVSSLANNALEISSVANSKPDALVSG